MALFGSLFDPNQREVRQHLDAAKSIAALEPELEALSDEQFRSRADALRERAKAGEELDDLLVEAFAIVRENCLRKLRFG